MRARFRSRRGLWSVYAVMGVLLLAYLVSLIIRRPDQQWPWLDNWMVAGFEIVGSGLCIARGFVIRHGRAVPLLLGFGLLSWAIGDVILELESAGGATPPTPSAADIFYLAFYPLAYIATVLLLRRALGQASRPNWLDGVVAGLGAAAVCAAFAFHGIVQATQGSGAAAATNLAYPIGDLLLLSLVVGGTALLSGSRKGAWYLIAVGITINVAGDTVNLLSSSLGTAKLGILFNDFAWPASILLMSMAAWLRSAVPTRSNPRGSPGSPCRGWRPRAASPSSSSGLPRGSAGWRWDWRSPPWSRSASVWPSPPAACGCSPKRATARP